MEGSQNQGQILYGSSCGLGMALSPCSNLSSLQRLVLPPRINSSGSSWGPETLPQTSMLVC